MSAGHQDPWRRRPAPREEAEEEPRERILGTASSDDPLDWDLKPYQSVPLRAPGQDYTLLVTGPGIANPLLAVAAVLRAAQDPAVDRVLRAAGFEHADLTEARPNGFVLRTAERTLWHADSPDVASGFRRLVQVLLHASAQTPGFREHLETLGLRPLLP
jgi:hypothetical protein